MSIKKSEGSFTSSNWLAAALGAAALMAAVSLRAQPITVPNSSFESQSGVGQPFGVNVFLDSWAKPPRPDYFVAIETNYSIYWIQTGGAFVDSNTPYANLQGGQAGYLLSFAQTAIFQDFDSQDWNDAEPTHEFNATYDPGKAYQLTVGVFGKLMTEGSMLNLSLYYREGDSMLPVASTTINYLAANFPTALPRNLVDYSVNLPTVQPTDAWAGKHIGIKFESVFGYGDGYWDFDNVRLTAIPEPGTLSLIAAGVTLVAWRLRVRRRA